ncbi:MAG: hypothetical protein MUD11_04320 [Rhodobacteraceae bacterium]|nr:hypothetical protein [Paracoccaceae bacterium]
MLRDAIGGITHTGLAAMRLRSPFCLSVSAALMDCRSALPVAMGPLALCLGLGG